MGADLSTVEIERECSLLGAEKREPGSQKNEFKTRTNHIDMDATRSDLFARVAE